MAFWGVASCFVQGLADRQALAHPPALGTASMAFCVPRSSCLDGALVMAYELCPPLYFTCSIAPPLNLSCPAAPPLDISCSAEPPLTFSCSARTSPSPAPPRQERKRSVWIRRKGSGLRVEFK